MFIVTIAMWLFVEMQGSVFVGSLAGDGKSGPRNFEMSRYFLFTESEKKMRDRSCPCESKRTTVTLNTLHFGIIGVK